MKNKRQIISSLILFSLWVVCGGLNRCVCEIEAFYDYAYSRTGGLNSEEFVAMGIKKNMNTNHVAALLSKADFRTGLLKMQYDGKEEKGFSQIFSFEYGPKWSPFYIGKPRSICNEWIKVSFDEEGLAQSVTRLSVSGLLVFAATKQVNLE